MHLHGFYFRIASRGDGRGDTVYASARGVPAGDLAVTEAMQTGFTAMLVWVPERAGNWLFHCHIPEHFGPGTTRDATGGAARADASTSARRVRLLVRPNVGSSADRPLFGYAVHERGPEPAPDSGLGAGPTLDLVRGEPVRITVVNRLPEPTAVHWHGIELESYYDGVPGFSGEGRRVTPLIAPGDSFEVRFTPPRAGTFIYHTHADELRQQLAGLAGVLVVREPGAPRDPAVDIPVLISSPSEFALQRRVVLVNGRPDPAPLRMRVGTTYRLRFVQMSTHRAGVWVELARADSTLVTWRPVAKDGAELHASRRVARPATQLMGLGETADYEVTPTTSGELRLEAVFGFPGTTPRVRAATLRIIVE
jgi:hypothetical protein